MTSPATEPTSKAPVGEDDRSFAEKLKHPFSDLRGQLKGDRPNLQLFQLC